MRLLKIRKLFLVINKDQLTALFGALYLFLSMQPFFLWYIPGASLIYLIPFMVILSHIIEVQGLRVRRNQYFIFAVTFVFSLYMAVPLFGHQQLIGKLFLYAPLFLFYFLSPKILLDIFYIWKKILIFFIVYAIIVYILFAFQVNLPHWKIENSEYIPLSSRANHYYRVYGLIVSSTNTLWRIGGILTQRLCGPFAEPGHFAIYIGLTLLIDRFLGNKLNIVMLLGGVLTLSPAFLIILAIIELYRILIEKKINYKFYLLFSIVLILLSIFKGSYIKDRVYYIVLERHTDLDKRAPAVVREKFFEIVKTPKVITGVGKEEFSSFGGTLSDPRGMIAKFGLIGLVITLTLVTLLLVGIPYKYSFFLLAAVMLVYIHRVWMFESTYIYTFMIMAGNAIKMRKESKTITSNLV